MSFRFYSLPVRQSPLFYQGMDCYAEHYYITFYSMYPPTGLVVHSEARSWNLARTDRGKT
ncbi:hypothetical protein P691DRAFT_803325, partial [Macrolepiota fuliginosa MF-IS2]